MVTLIKQLHSYFALINSLSAMSEVATYEVSGYKEKTTTANNILKALFQMLLVSGVHPGQGIQIYTEPTDEVSGDLYPFWQ